MFFHGTIKNIGFISTRFQGTDGVTLETEKWEAVLRELGYRTFYFAGLCDKPRSVSMTDPLAFWETPAIKRVQAGCFNVFVRERRVTERIKAIAGRLKRKLYAFVRRFKIDLVIIENALSIPLNIPLGVAITEFIAETGLPAIGHHHDLYWERQRFIVNAVNDYLKMAFPPSLPSMQHVVINSQSQKDLGYRRGLNTELIPNVYDFSVGPPGMDRYNKTLRADLGLNDDDIFILQPTRVIARKGIEHSIELVARLENPKARLVITHQTKDEGKEYLKRVRSYAELLGVDLIIRPDIVGHKRAQRPEGGKIYALADLYANADLVTYPSTYEGFGNAFLEAIYFKKPLFVNRYSIYQRDIEHLGFDVVTMETFIDDHVVEEVRRLLEDKKRQRKMTELNFSLGKKYFSYTILKEHLKTLLIRFQGNVGVNGHGP